MPALEIDENVRCGGKYSALVGGMNSSAPGALTSRATDARTRHAFDGENVAVHLRGAVAREEQHGRHHYHSLASSEIARMLEGLQQVASTQNIKHAGRTIRTGPRDAAMRVARGCYDHMAGHLAVSVTDAMLGRGQIEFDGDGGNVTDAGKVFLEKFGIDLAAAKQSKRIFCRPCLDWSERRFHLAGAVGAALLHRTLELNWVKRQNDTRALAITRAGEQGFRKAFGIEQIS